MLDILAAAVDEALDGDEDVREHERALDDRVDGGGCGQVTEAAEDLRRR